MASLKKSNIKTKIINATGNSSVSIIPVADGQIIIDKNYDAYIDINATRHLLGSSINTLATNNKSAISDYIDAFYHIRADQIASDSTKTREDMNALFVEWWNVAKNNSTSNNDLMWRWFKNVLYDNRTHGVKMPRYSSSTSYIGEKTDDSVGLVCDPSTSSSAGRDDFAKLPQFWCVEVAVDKNPDGTHTIVAVQYINSDAEVRNGNHLCWVLQKNTFRKEYNSGNYTYLKIRSKAVAPDLDWKTWPQGTDKNGTVYPYIGNPKYFAGIKNCSDGSKITCGTNLEPYNMVSHKGGVDLWHEKGDHMSGASGHLLRWQMDMVRLKYATKGNSNIIPGCYNYNYQYTAAISESNVESIVLTTDQAANLLVGSCVSIGIKNSDNNSTDRYYDSMNSLCRKRKITNISNTTINGTTYARVYVDNGGTKFNTVANTTYISTMPYWSGWNDSVLGNDGSKINYNTGKEPGLIQKTEFMIGAYLIVSDELLQWGKNSSGNYILDIYVCHDQSLVSKENITSDYKKLATYTFPSDVSTNWHWEYIGDTLVDSNGEFLWPENLSASGTGVGVQAGFNVYVAASGVRASWCCGVLNYGGNASLACRYSRSAVGSLSWDGVLGSPGLAG